MSDLVIVNSGQAVVSSRQVAENFRKRHADVIRSIESHISDLLLTDAKVRWFYESSYTDGKGEAEKAMNAQIEWEEPEQEDDGKFTLDKFLSL